MTSALTNQQRVFKVCLTQAEQVSDDVTRKIGPLDFRTKTNFWSVSNSKKKVLISSIEWAEKWKTNLKMFCKRVYIQVTYLSMCLLVHKLLTPVFTSYCRWNSNSIKNNTYRCFMIINNFQQKAFMIRLIQLNKPGIRWQVLFKLNKIWSCLTFIKL